MWWKRKSQDFQAEIDAHLQLEADELNTEGLTPSEAQAAARRAFGNRALAEERFFESDRWMFVHHLVRDLRFALRVLRKDAKFSVLAVLGLALGIGVSTAIFAIASTLLSMGIEDVRSPASYVGLHRRTQESNLSFAEYRYFQDRSTTLADISAESAPYNLVLGPISPGGDPEDVLARFESAAFLSVRRLHPALGRSFSTEDEQPGHAPVAILGYRFWQQRFAGDHGILGKTIVLNAHAVAIVGVADSSFQESNPPDFLLPIALQPVLLDRGDWLHDAGVPWLAVTARLRPRMTVRQAQAEADVLGNAFDASPSPANKGFFVTMGGVNPERRRSAVAAKLAITLAVSMILMVACSNLASLLLARITVRRREIGVRLSLGAGRMRLVCQLLTESLLLAVTGGALGFVFSTWLAKLLLVSLNRGPYVVMHFDHWVPLYCLALSVVIGFSFGLGPALAATKMNLARALHAEGLSGTPSSPSRKVWSPRNLLVVVPLAASLMLLIGAAFMVRSVQRAHAARPAFDPSSVIGMSFRLKAQGYDDARTLQFQNDLRERVSAMPGIASIALASDLPLSFPPAAMCALVTEGPAASPGIPPACNGVSEGFFETLGVPIVRGRSFSPSDREGSAPVAIVSQDLARRYWPDQDPLGKRIRTAGGNTFFEVVGVAMDLDDPQHPSGPPAVFPTAYVPAGQGGLLLSTQRTRWNGARILAPQYQISQMQFVIRATGDPAHAKAALRQAVRAADPNLWVRIETIEERLEPFTGPLRTITLVLTALGGLVLVMASVGIYALLAYGVSQRTHEIGIRMALGADRLEILSLIMSRTMILIASGIGLGLAGALVLTRILASRIRDAGRPDAVICIAAAVVLGLVSIVAGYLPARKALRVNPVQALRCD